MSSDYISSIASNPMLTNYATGIAEEQFESVARLADVLAPRVPVPGSVFRHYQWDKKVQLQLPPDTRRPLGGAAHRVAFGADQVERSLDTHGLDIVIDDKERRTAANADPLTLEKMKIQTLVMSALRAHVSRVITTVDTGITAATGGVWTTMTNDPVAEINTACDEIQVLCGSLPNFCVMGLTAWRRFIANTITKNTIKGTANRQVITPSDTVGGFINPNLQIVIAETLYDGAALGLSASLSRMIGSVAYLFYASTAPNVSDGSYAKTFFNMETGLVQVGQMYRDAERRSDVYPSDWDALTVVTNSTAAKKFTVT